MATKSGVGRMLIANVECDEIINQIVTSATQRTWNIKFVNPSTGYLGEPSKQRIRRDKRRLQKIAKRLELSEGLDYELEQEIIYPDLDTCLIALHSKLKFIQDKTQCTKMVLWLGPDDGSNFRFKSAVTAPYKGTRGPKPEILKQLRQYMIDIKGANVIYGYEADDALGINQDYSGLIKTLAVHCDKDIYMIPGDHYNPMTDEFTTVSELGELRLVGTKVKGNGLSFFYLQLIIGDRVDNIPPMKKGKGEKWAYELLRHDNSEQELLENVILTYRTELSDDIEDTKWRDRLLEQADLVWMCRNKEETGRDYIKRRYKELTGRTL